MACHQGAQPHPVGPGPQEVTHWIHKYTWSILQRVDSVWFLSLSVKPRNGVGTDWVPEGPPHTLSWPPGLGSQGGRPGPCCLQLLGNSTYPCTEQREGGRPVWPCLSTPLVTPDTSRPCVLKEPSRRGLRLFPTKHQTPHHIDAGLGVCARVCVRVRTREHKGPPQTKPLPLPSSSLGPQLCPENLHVPQPLPWRPRGRPQTTPPAARWPQAGPSPTAALGVWTGLTLLPRPGQSSPGCGRHHPLQFL